MLPLLFAKLLLWPFCSGQIYPFQKWDSSSMDQKSFRAFTNQRVHNQILDKLLNASRYDGRLRPNATTDDPAIIFIRLTLSDVTEVNEKAFSYTSDFIIEQKWLDLRLRFKGLIPVANDTYIVVRDKWTEKIWMPDIYFTNSRKGFRQDLTRRNQEMRIYPNGTVMFSLRLTMTLRCDMKLSRYPLDTQHCFVNLSSFNYADRDLRFKWSGYEAVSIMDIALPAFDVRREYFLSECTNYRTNGRYSCISVKLAFARQFRFHVMQTYLPTSLLVVASWMSFWIDPMAVPARVSLSVTLLLSMLTLATGIRQSLPPVSDIKAVDVWTFACIFFVFAALFEFSIMNYATTKLKRGESLCGWSNCCKPKSVEPQVVVISHGESNSSTEKTQDNEDKKVSLSSDDGKAKKKRRARIVEPPKKKESAPGKDRIPLIYNIDRISQYLFPTCFVIFNIIYWPMYSYSA